MAKHCAIGLRAHSGWAALVVIGGKPESPELIARRRIEIADTKISGSKQPFHTAEPMNFPDAKAHIDRCSKSTLRLSTEAITAAIDGLRDRGCEAKTCGIILVSGRTLPALEVILKSHALIHTAEGEFYRQALVEAASRCKLPVRGVKERELHDRAAQELAKTAVEIERRIAAIGKAAGPPWTQDQKYAALVAWMALEAYESDRYSRSK